MTDYRPIFTIRLEHDYYMHNQCRAIQFRLSSEGASLLKRRNLIIKQTTENEWSIIGNCEGAGVFDASDILKLEMILSEPKFVYFTDWRDFQAKYAYHLNMPCKKTVEEAQQVMHYTDVKRKDNILCSIDIKLSNQMFEKAKIGETITNTILFHSPKLRWEYLLVSRNKESNKNLKIEDNRSHTEFSQIKKIKHELFPFPIFSTITTSLIPMSEHYDFTFSLVEIVRKDPLMKRVLIKHLSHPQPGAYISDDPDTIRQIIYY